MNSRALLACASSAAALGAAASQLVVSNVFSDHAVLQRDGAGASVWGTGAPGDTVTTTGLGAAKLETVVDSAGVWRQRLPPQPAGTRAQLLTFSASSGGAATLADVVWGDVIMCGGQSNMQFTVSQAFNATAELAAADDPAYEAIRVMTVGTGTSSHTPLSRLGSVFQPWAPVSSKSLGVGNWTAFSAVCWFTGRDVFEGLNRTVPLGLISNNWGGTPIEYWSPSETIDSCPGGYGNATGNDTSLWNAMVVPYTVGPMALHHVLWFQGETDLSMTGPDPAHQEWARYGCLFLGMAQAWRDGLGPDPSGAPLWFAIAHLEPWNVPPEYNAALAGLRAQQLLAPLAAGSRVTFATAMDLGDPTSPFHPVHFRRKQQFSARLAAAVLGDVYALPGHAHAHPTLASASGSVVDGGATLQVTVTFQPGSSGVGPLLLNASATACPRGGAPYNFSAAACAGPQIQGSDGVWRNATVAVGADGATVVMAAPVAAPRGAAGLRRGEGAAAAGAVVTPVACAYGWGVWPLVSVYTAEGFPALPWNVSVAPAAGRG